MYNIRKGQLVEVAWTDPSIKTDWIDAKSVTRLAEISCHSIGWVHLVNKEGVILTACYCDASVDSREDLLLQQHLPWGSITQVWILES